MAAVDTNRLASSGLTVGRLPSLSFWATLKSWNDARLTRNALYNLSDRSLADIGLTRDDIGALSETLAR